MGFLPNASVFGATSSVEDAQPFLIAGFVPTIFAISEPDGAVWAASKLHGAGVATYGKGPPLARAAKLPR